MLICDVELTSVDPATAGHRYAELLEVTPTIFADRAELVVGQSRLLIVTGESGPGAHHLAFTVPGRWFDAAVDRLSNRAGLLAAHGQTQFEGPPHWNSLSVYFAGPGGAVLEFIQRRDLADEPLMEQASPGSAIAGISEIGVAARDVPELRLHLADDFGLEPFGSPFADFAPIGDQHGLLICVGPDRPWYPEGVQRSHGGQLRVTWRPRAAAASSPSTRILGIGCSCRVTEQLRPIDDRLVGILTTALMRAVAGSVWQDRWHAAAGGSALTQPGPSSCSLGEETSCQIVRPPVRRRLDC